ncbi:MAG: hypothetical protein KME43_04905 [Myxacorys chilensis ATA2-1-KO14]|jgi:hypothetical protein|nr:hypothetical protein [Myxacorys chilensis ATA2-1-KO14]
MLQQENKVNADVIIAHNVKTSGNVAATFHIEPSHNPKAGERSQAWFALTKQGGELVSLDRCNCSLNVYDRQQNSVLQPALKSISAEQYQGIPGAELVFPKAGIYTLELSGRPKDGESFNAFRLTYEVTVQAGAAPQAAIGTAESSRPSAPSTGWVLAGVALPLIALLVGVLWMLKTKQKR